MLLLCVFYSLGCSHLPPSSSLEFFNEQVIPKSLKSSHLPIGGLSALTFDKKTGFYFALSDDKKNHRFYKLHLTKQQPYKFKVKKQILLRERATAKNLKRNMDPEGIALNQSQVFISSEGQQIFTPPEPPQIFRFSLEGILKEAKTTPAIFWNPKNTKTFGTQENKGFESLSIDSQKKLLWTATEKPLLQDLKISNKKIRLSGFDLKTNKLLFQFSYSLYHADSGLVEVISLKNKTFLTLERSYKEDKKAHFVKLFLTNCNKATNIIHSPSSFSPCKKKQLFDFKQNLKSIKIENIEGMALGPLLPSGKRLIVFVSDDNFRANRKNQILFFGLSPSDLI